MQQSSRRPPSYPTATPTPTPATPRAAKSLSVARPAAVAAGSQPAFTPAPSYTRPAVVVRPGWLRLLGVGGILHASAVLMTLVIFSVMWLGGDSRVALMTSAIRNHSGALWTWALFAAGAAFVLGFVLLYNAIGTLSLSPWSRRTSVTWSTVWLALATATLIVNLGWVYPLLGKVSAERFSFGRLMIVTWVHIAAGIVWPGVVLFMMSTKRVKDLYARIASGAATM